MSAHDGGSAFPCLPPQDTAAGVAVGYPHPEAGMSLRDYFAAKAMEALINMRKGSGEAQGAFRKGAQYTACTAYQMADAMLAERAKGQA